jgi:hypothetical protein
VKYLSCCLVIALSLTGCGSVADVAGEDDGGGSNVVEGDRSGTSQKVQGDPSDLQVVGAGFTQLPPDSIGNSYISYGAVLRNVSSAIANRVTVNLTFKNASGTVVKAVSETISFILPGQTNAVGGNTDGEGAASLEVKALVDRWEESETQTGTFSVSGITTRNEQFGGLKTNANVASTFGKDLQDTKATAIYYNAAGTIIGGAFTFLDFVPAGGNIGIEITSGESLKGVAKTDVFVEITSLSLL